MNALFINPPVYDFALFDLFIRPFGLMRIAGWLESADYNVTILDCLDTSDRFTEQLVGKTRRRNNGTGKFFKSPVSLPEGLASPGRDYFRYGIAVESLIDRLQQVQPDIIFVGSGMTYWYPGVAEVIALCRKFHPGIPLVTGGVYASLLPEHCRNTCMPDYCVSGPALPALAEIITAENLPLPALAEIPLLPYYHEAVWKDAGVLRLNEGCAYNCDYCASGILSRGFHPGSGEDLYRRFRCFYDRGVRNFGFYDDALLINKSAGLYAFLARIIDHGDHPVFYLPNAVHARQIDAECAGLMYRAGFKEIRLGYESDSDDFHTRHGSEKTGRNAFVDAVEHLKVAGYDGKRIIAYTLAGLPGQTAKEAEQAARFASAQGVRVSVSEYSPIPGTGLWDEACSVSRYDLAGEPIYHSNSFFACEWSGFTRADMKRIKKQVYQSNRKLLA